MEQMHGMQGLEFWRAVTADRADTLARVFGLLKRLGTRWCVIGGTAVNAYVEPVATLDLDLVIVSADLPDFVRQLADCRVERCPYHIEISASGSELRIQIQTDPRYQAFIDRAVPRQVLGITLPVAAVDDVPQGKLWAVQDSQRRASKRQKDLADLARLIERYPKLRERVPVDVLGRML